MNTGVTASTASTESKALRLARYLKEFVGLRSTTVYDLNKYESVLWFGDMQQERECQSPAWNNEFEAGDPWLVVHKQQFPKPPVPPEIILPWIESTSLKARRCRDSQAPTDENGARPGSRDRGADIPGTSSPNLGDNGHRLRGPRENQSNVVRLGAAPLLRFGTLPNDFMH